ncbi:helix-turn-helix domain-containing protein [Iningainema tapete]|uniref:Helix-turn-helix transcriptional regulator n=1 Tax=Iningainema tapete BLCC-T55 TaxID=2748662 RepID=A0A8J6XQ81_9CYAN|nr:AraC family transcriptional regulator [Iningainema tapete]MBD2771358.1 helix-turn-helix transcriptional regulator [Iningainema tapete BLCC-T55]
MTREKPLIINFASDKSILQISPILPILSSQKASWNGIQIGYYQYPAAFETPEHCFSQHFMTIHLNHATVVKEQVLDGRLQCDRFRDGDICLTPATAPVSVRLQDSCELICLYLEPTFMTRITAEVADVDRLEVVPQFKLNDPLIYQIGIALKVKLESKGVCDRLYAESMATAISAHLVQYYSTSKPKIRSYSNGLPQARLRQATEYIYEHLAQNPSLTEMAQMVQMSPYYFSRLFKQSTGLTPHQYLIKCRIEQAKRLLKTTNLSIAKIAQQVGFVDQSHLTRHFKRHVGVPPSQFP